MNTRALLTTLLGKDIPANGVCLVSFFEDLGYDLPASPQGVLVLDEKQAVIKSVLSGKVSPWLRHLQSFPGLVVCADRFAPGKAGLMVGRAHEFTSSWTNELLAFAKFTNASRIVTGVAGGYWMVAAPLLSFKL